MQEYTANNIEWNLSAAQTKTNWEHVSGWVSKVHTSLSNDVHIDSNLDNRIDATSSNVYAMNHMQDSGSESTSHNVLSSTLLTDTNQQDQHVLPDQHNACTSNVCVSYILFSIILYIVLHDKHLNLSNLKLAFFCVPTYKMSLHTYDSYVDRPFT